MKWEDGRGGAMLIPDDEYDLILNYPDKSSYQIARCRDVYEALYWTIKMNKNYKHHKMSCKITYRKAT